MAYLTPMSTGFRREGGGSETDVMDTHPELAGRARVLDLEPADVVLEEERDGAKVGVGVDPRDLFLLELLGGHAVLAQMDQRSALALGDWSVVGQWRSVDRARTHLG